MSHSLLFDGNLELCDSSGSSPEDFWFETLAEGASFGDPEPIEAAIASLLRDGALTVTQAAGNREVSLLVTIRSTDSGGLDAGVAALHRATQKRSTLKWTAGDGLSDSWVFDVETSSLHNPEGFNDLAFLRNQQTYRLRLVCLPYRRRESLTVDSAGSPPSSGGTVVESCDTVDGWARTYEPTSGAAAPVADTVVKLEGVASVEIEAGLWFNDATDQNGNEYSKGASVDERTGLSLDTGVGGYLSIWLHFDYVGARIYDNYGEAYETGVNEIKMTTAEGGVKEVDFIASETDADGWTRFVWPVEPSRTVTALRIGSEQYRSGHGHPRPSVRYDAVTLSTAATTDQQILKSVDVLGSARTPGSVHVASPDDGVGLGQVLVATVAADKVPAGFRPDGRRWVVSGTTEADAGASHGSSFPNMGGVFEVPLNSLAQGAHAMVVRMRTGADPLSFSGAAQLIQNGVAVGATSPFSVSRPNTDSTFQMIPAGTVYLPPVPVMNPSPSAKVRITFSGGGSLDDFYLIPIGADYSIIDCGNDTVSGSGSSSHLWVDSPSQLQPRGGYWRGANATRGDSLSAWPNTVKPGIHMMTPPKMLVFVGSTNADGPTVDVSYHEAQF